MPAFLWSGTDAEGRQRSERVEAENAQAARAALVSAGWTNLELVAALREPVSNLDFQKLLFLYTQQCEKRLSLVGDESGNDETLTRIKKGVTTDQVRRFTKGFHDVGVVIHGTFILGLPIETRASAPHLATPIEAR